MKLKSIFNKFGKKELKGMNIYIFSTVHEQLIIPTQITWDKVLEKGTAFSKNGLTFPIYNDTIWCYKNKLDYMMKSELYGIMNRKVGVDTFLENDNLWRRV